MHPAVLTLIITGTLGVIFAALKILIPKYVEKVFDHRFEKEIEKYRSQLAAELEHEKTDLAVWSELRKDILMEKWAHHKLIMKHMSAVILGIQQMEYDEKPVDTVQELIEQYRAVVHQSMELISEKGVDICQKFLEASYEALDQNNVSLDTKPKEIRFEFRTNSMQEFGIERMMPKMAGATSA